MRTTIRNTVYYCLRAIPSVFVIGMVLALCLQRIARGSGPFRSLFYVADSDPICVGRPDLALRGATRFWRAQCLPGALSVSHPKTGSGIPTLVMPSIAMLEVWRGVGFWTLLFLAALLALPTELYQAATIDGASGWQQLRHITLPLMRPTFFFAVVMATIWNLQLFDSVSILTDGGPSNASATVVWYIYKAMFQFNDKTGFAARP